MRARALVALLVVGCIAVADRMGGADPTWTIESALRSSGLAHSRTAGGAFVVIFAATHARDVETWPVTVRSVAGGDWVLVFATLLRADPGKLDEDVLKEALLHNSRTAGGKLALDAETGDLDVQYEIPSVALTPELLRLIINDVAATCDAQYRPFRDLVD